MSFEVTRESRAVFVSLLAKGNTLQRAAEKARIPIVWAKPIGAEHGWPDLGRLASEADALHGRVSEPAVEVPQEAPQGTQGAPEEYPGMDALADRLTRLTGHGDWRVAAAAQTVVADLERLFTALRVTERTIERPPSRAAMQREAFVADVLADYDAGVVWEQIAESRGITVEAVHRRLARAGVRFQELAQLTTNQRHYREQRKAAA